MSIPWASYETEGGTASLQVFMRTKPGESVFDRSLDRGARIIQLANCFCTIIMAYMWKHFDVESGNRLRPPKESLKSPLSHLQAKPRQPERYRNQGRHHPCEACDELVHLLM